MSKALQNIGLFKEKECSKELWNILNVVLKYGSFNSVKRAEALARAGEVVPAVRVFTSEGVLDAKEHIQKLQKLYPQEDPPMMPDSLDNMHGDSSSHAPFTSADFRWSVKNAKLKRADALGWRADIIKQ